MSLLIGDYLTQHAEYSLSPKGIFIIDSPIDLAQLYVSSEKNIARNFSEVSVQESNWILETLGTQLGNPHEDLEHYEKHSVFTLSTENTQNLNHLRNTKIRLYTEPDSLWWKEHRMADFEQTNAFLIENLSKRLKQDGFLRVEYIPTKDKGYRANGERHPHSWSIVDKEDLITWMLDKKQAPHE